MALRVIDIALIEVVVLGLVDIVTIVVKREKIACDVATISYSLVSISMIEQTFLAGPGHRIRKILVK